VFEERYSGGVLDMNIFCLMIVTDNEKVSSSGSHNGQSSNGAAVFTMN